MIAEFVEHIVGPVWLGGDLGVEADQGLAQVGLDQGFVGLAREMLGSQVVPAQAGDLAVPAG
ncbi:MAG: hypothetical protein HYW07_24770 [Candidatus Latescibacteria bacterium]|nr:hypothetical protein [Candidatus Latescibacterota bacterium]